MGSTEVRRTSVRRAALSRTDQRDSSCCQRAAASSLLPHGTARWETTECHIYNVFVLIEVDIGAALQNQQPLRKTRALLVRCGEGSFSRGCRAAVRRSGRHHVGVGINRQWLCYPCGATTRPASGDDGCSQRYSQGCERVRRLRLFQFTKGKSWPVAKLHRPAPALGDNAAPSNSLTELSACCSTGQVGTPPAPAELN